MPKLIDLTGKKFGRLTVLGRTKNSKKRYVEWKCRCECGAITVVQGGNLKNGATKSCGCLANILSKKRKLIHGMSYTPEYIIWNNMKNRCLNPKDKNYKNYGGRGIKIYPEWIESFQTFLDYVGLRPTPKHMIERIDNNKGYFPGNVTWALRKEQNNNKRNNHPITIGKITLNICQWGRKMGIDPTIISVRINRLGWPPEKAVLQPIKHYKH